MKRPLILTIADKRSLTKVPAKYSGLVGQQLIGKTFLVLDGDREDVLTSKEIEKIITKTKFKDGLKYTWLVPNMTIEAEEIVLLHGQDLIRLDNFHWTDETYSQRKQRLHEFLVVRKQQL